MRRQLLAFVASGVIFGCLASTGLAQSAVESAMDQYPGSVRLIGPDVDVSLLRERVIRDESVYETRDAYVNVEEWYMHRLRQAPAAKPDKAGGCSAVGQSGLMLWIDYSEFVLICAVPHGTRILVRHKLQLLP